MKEYSTIHIGNLTIELTNGIIKVNDTIVELLVHEYKLLSILARADINSWVSIEDIEKKMNHSNIRNCIPRIQKELSKHKSTINIIESLTGEYIKLGPYVLDIYKYEFDDSSNEIQEKEELIDKLRYQIRRDMEDYKLLNSRILGNDKDLLFGKEYYIFFDDYLEEKIKDNIKKLRELVNVR